MNIGLDTVQASVNECKLIFSCQGQLQMRWKEKGIFERIFKN